MKKNLRISKNITSESIDNNVYILNINDGEYYKLSESASIIWKDIESGLDSDGIKVILKSRFPDAEDIDDDVDELIRNFVSLGLVIDN
tara:strand:- start:548 stop:811 length:264 start_codon:yes stop_codon:yes gene_type:complete